MSNPWFIQPDHNGQYTLEFEGVEIAVGLTATQLVALTKEVVDALVAERNKKVESKDAT